VLLNRYEPYIRVKDFLAEHPHLRFVFLELTNQCNLKCKHCGSKCPSQKEQEQIETEFLLKAIDEVTAYTHPGDLMFCITGGEPLLRNDWYVICEHIAAKGFSWGMTTNGTLITPQTIALMKKAKMQTISVSIDGLKENHEWLRNVKGCFDKAICAIQLLMNSGVSHCVQVTTVVNTRNLYELPQLHRYLKELGVDSWKITATEPIGNAVGQKDLFLSNKQYCDLLDFVRRTREESSMEVTYGCSHFLPEEYETSVRGFHFHCGAGTFIASISAQGDILACLDIEDREFTKQGNIKVDNFWDVWNERYQLFRQPRNLSNSKCSSCFDKDFCRGDSWHTWDFFRQEPKVCLRMVNERED